MPIRKVNADRVNKFSIIEALDVGHTWSDALESRIHIEKGLNSVPGLKMPNIMCYLLLNWFLCFIIERLS